MTLEGEHLELVGITRVEMRLLLLLGALAILSFDVALAGNIGFDLPRFK